MTYQAWFTNHGTKHTSLLSKLTSEGLSPDQIVHYFRFENMAEKQKNFCPLYAKKEKCHDIENLNCYLCACPNFRFSDEGIEKIGDKTVFSYCVIESREGKAVAHGDAIHQDCSKCTVPHHEKYIEKNIGKDWFEIMKMCKK